MGQEKKRPIRPFRLRRILRKPLVVPETKPLNQLIDDFRKDRTHMAIVVDEFGTISGLVTMEDVLEQVFGEIEDEHDELRAKPPAEADVLESTARPRSAISRHNTALSCRPMRVSKPWRATYYSSSGKSRRPVM